MYWFVLGSGSKDGKGGKDNASPCGPYAGKFTFFHLSEYEIFIIKKNVFEKCITIRYNFSVSSFYKFTQTIQKNHGVN